MQSELTPVEASKALGVGRLYIYELLASGHLKGRKVLGRWLIPLSQIEAYQRDHPRVGSRRRNQEADHA